MKLFIHFLNKNMMQLLLLCFLLMAPVVGSKGCLTEEKTALLHIKSFLNETTLVGNPLSSWVYDPNSDCCRWNRVTCNPFSGHVTKLHLQDLQVSGIHVSIDFSLFRTFKELRSLILSGGHFETLIHTEVLANLSNLEVLSLEANFISGPLPTKGLCGMKKIQVLDLSDNDFSGALPKCIANLTSLQALDLSRNHLSREIPKSAISSLTSLEYLSLLYNSFEGTFHLSSLANNSKLKILALEMPDYANDIELQVDTEGEADVTWVPSFQLEVLHMPKCKLNAPNGILPSFLSYQHELQHLDLSENNLVGEFPNWLLANNTKLKSLKLHGNSFTGPFELPTNMDLLPHPLYYLKLAHNKIASKLPEDIGLIFPNLKYLNLSSNGLHGTIPTSVGNMSKLIALDLGKNNLSGEVPQTLWNGCASLRLMILSYNSLLGKPFPLPLNLSHLQLLFMNDNYFNGTLQNAILHLPTLGVLDISNNELWGTIPDLIANLSKLQVINLSGNNLAGTLPIELCKLDLSSIHLSHNELSGSIPACYLNLTVLITLQLQSNNLVGSIPQLSHTSSLITLLDLRNNNLSGTIPDWLDYRVDLLRALLLGGNHLDGQLPESLCQLTRINFLDLSSNRFTGTIPACFSNFSFDWSLDYFAQYVEIEIPQVSQYLYHRYHMLLRFTKDDNSFPAISDGIEVEFRTKSLLLPYKRDIMRLMSGIDLSCNQLTGLIPQELGYLASLHGLNLSHNHLNGSIPESFYKLKEIESLDLSYNNLSGKIPPQLQDLNSLGVFNVSYNNLSGTVPDKGQFGTFDESSFRGNPHLLLNNSNRGTPRPQRPPSASFDGEDDDSVIDFTVFYWSFAASYVTVILLLITILWINPRWQRAWFYFIETCLFKCFHHILKDAFY